MKTNKQQGFSLLEILIAFSILALSLSILLKIFSVGVTTSTIAEEYTAAVQIAESLMARTGVETPLQAGESSGLENEKYDWQVTVSPFQFNPENADINAVTAVLFKVRVTVTWGDEDGHTDVDSDKRQIQLVTLKIVNKVL